MNTFGRLLRLTTWGESHGVAIGGILDGFPAGFRFNLDEIQRELDRRAPGKNPQSSPRKEPDQVEILSGIFEGYTTGTPIAYIIHNRNQKSEDYTALKDAYRPGHADLSYALKYGIRDPRGGGRASARETAIRVVAGAMAKQWLEVTYGIEVLAYTDQIGKISKPQDIDVYPYSYGEIKAQQNTLLRHPNPATEEAMIAEIDQARSEGDSVGGVVCCIAYNMPHSLGEPLYDKLEARLASAMMSINAVRGFEIGDGFASTRLRGSQNNDPMFRSEAQAFPAFRSNHAGGVLGGISTGQELRMRIAFKPTPSIAQTQETYNDKGEANHKTINIRGRHDPCVVPRALPVVEAMCALVLMDMILLRRSNYPPKI